MLEIVVVVVVVVDDGAVVVVVGKRAGEAGTDESTGF